MTEEIVKFLQEVTNNNYLTLFLVSIIPIIELRGAILLIPGMPDVNLIAGIFVCVAGSSVVIIPLVLLIKPIIKAMKKTKLFKKVAEFAEGMISDRAEKVKKKAESDRKLSPGAKKFWGLFTFTAIPLPLTGAWMGSCVGAFLNFNTWLTCLSVFLGNVVASFILAILVTLLPVKFIDIALYAFFAIAFIVLATTFTIAIVKKIKKDKKVKLSLQTHDIETTQTNNIETEKNGDERIAGDNIKDYEDESGKK